MNKKLCRVAYQGEPGAYSEEAVYKYFGNDVKSKGFETLSLVFNSVEKDTTAYAVVPVENSIEGSIGRTYDLLLQHNLNVYGEIFHKIRHCLISFPETNIDSIKKVFSHPQALGQSREFLEQYPVQLIPHHDTAGSVRMIREKKLTDAAAIASERAAQIYDMQVLEKGIETNTQNYTRFLVLSKKDAKRTGNDKTSIIFTVKHAPGTLYKALGIFSVSDINLTKIESRPIIGKPWQYTFFLDFEGYKTDKLIKNALEILRHNTLFMKIIGSYPKANIPH